MQSLNTAVALLSGATATGAGEAHKVVGTKMSFQSVGTVSTSTGSAEIDIEVSNDGSNWIIIGDDFDGTATDLDLTLGTSATTNAFNVDQAWLWIRANVKAITGTNATVSVYMAVNPD